jgi:hypothetical protein
MDGDRRRNSKRGKHGKDLPQRRREHREGQREKEAKEKQSAGLTVSFVVP